MNSVYYYYPVIALACSGVLVLLVYGLGVAVYNLCFHPPRAFPEPFLARASRIYCIYYDLQGHLHSKALSLHEKFGQVVRIALNELSYNSDRAWQDIYGRYNQEKDREKH
ncbi:uncharacterized protein PAC_10148 [Phialocephala subalpina]|uniref:Uncharacterized protein n=1 Tax=Phialocephala subalpina TaxID=576137 RepID=A0A1L7X5F4_9HELO|nr:uncharacterized protein PAC_10148 [Phialocephala subalpina]